MKLIILLVSLAVSAVEAVVQQQQPLDSGIDFDLIRKYAEDNMWNYYRSIIDR